MKWVSGKGCSSRGVDKRLSVAVALLIFVSPLPATPQLFAHGKRFRNSASIYRVCKKRSSGVAD